MHLGNWEDKTYKFTILYNIGEAKGGIKIHLQDSSLGD